MKATKKGPDVEVVDIRLISGDGNLKAFADIKLAGCFIVKGFSVMRENQGFIVLFPRKPSKDGKWFDTVLPLDEKTKLLVENLVLEAYDKEISA